LLKVNRSQLIKLAIALAGSRVEGRCVRRTVTFFLRASRSSWTPIAEIIVAIKDHVS
jgi:hypothetical protein